MSLTGSVFETENLDFWQPEKRPPSILQGDTNGVHPFGQLVLLADLRVNISWYGSFVHVRAAKILDVQRDSVRTHIKATCAALCWSYIKHFALSTLSFVCIFQIIFVSPPPLERGGGNKPRCGSDWGCSSLCVLAPCEHSSRCKTGGISEDIPLPTNRSARRRWSWVEDLELNFSEVLVTTVWKYNTRALDMI